MSRIMFIDGSHREQIRVAVTEKGRVTEFDVESFDNKQTIGNIYLAKITRIEPSLQAAFVEYGAGRQGFLPFAEIHPDYYQIPLEDRKRLLESAAEYYNNRNFKEETTDELSEDSHNEASETEQDISEIDDHNSANPETSQELAAEVPEEIVQEIIDVTENLSEETPQVDLADTISGENHGEVNQEISDDVSRETQEGEQSSQDSSQSVQEKSKPPRKRLPQYKIQEVIKKRQILLIQVIKSERGNKGAALTTYLSLAGRYCVLMPNTACGGGISRKITNVTDRQKLRIMVKEFQVPEGMGLIVRTAGSQRTKAELYRDYEYLVRLWDSIRELTLSSTAPALVYEEGNIIKRALRDIYTRDTSKIYVQGAEVYKEARGIMKMIMPSVARFVHHYKNPLPLFSRYQIERQLDELTLPEVTLKSGGYLVINHTEALIAIDINSGKSTNSYSIEETALRTNLEAVEEIARQLKLRDLAGLIVIDFIDMSNHANTHAVERKMRECLKHDKARTQTTSISNFGLMEMTRQRLRPAMKDLMSVPCSHCNGTGYVPSLETSSLRILRAIYEEIFQKTLSSVTLNCSMDIGHYLLNKKRKELFEVETAYNLTIEINSSSRFSVTEYEISSEIAVNVPMGEAASSHHIDMDDLEDQGIPLEENSEEEEAPSGKKTRGNRRGRKRQSDKERFEEVDTQEVADIDDVDLDASDEKKSPRGKRSKFSRKRNDRDRGRFSKHKPEAEIYTTKSGNDVIIENVVSVQHKVVESVAPSVEADQPISQEVSIDHEPQAQTAIQQEAVQETSSEDVKSEIETNIPQTHADHPQEAEAQETKIQEKELVTVSVEPSEPEVQKSARRGWWRSRFSK